VSTPANLPSPEQLKAVKRINAHNSSAQSAVWGVFDQDGQDLELWISKLWSYGWCATYAPGASFRSMKLASMMRGKNFPTRRELLEEISSARLVLELSDS